MVSTKTKTNLQTLRCLSIRRYISMYALVELQTYSEYHNLASVINKTIPWTTKCSGLLADDII